MANDVQHRAGVVAKRERITDGSQIDYILIDGSGSMVSRWYPTLQALQGYVEEIRTVNTRVIAAVFESRAFTSGFNYTIIAEDSAKSFPSLLGNACPGGGTPLYDAINTMGRELRDLDPVRCAITIATDGEERDSRTSLAQARAILDWCRAKGWEVTFLGCDFNNLEQAAELGVDKAHAIGVHSGRLHEVTKALGTKRKNYSATGGKMGFSDDEKGTFGGYLAPPSK